MIVAPVFSPRCPYKVTFLVNAFKVLRKWIRRAVHLARQRSHHDSHNSDSDSVLSQPFGSTKFGWFEEEEDAVTSPKGDLRIFLAVDAMLADDNLIDGFYRGQIQQLRSRGPEVIDFVLDVMGRRMRDRVSRTRLPLQNLRPMSKVAWVGLTGILADVMEDSIVQDMVHPAHPDDDSPRERSLVDWMKDILKIVLSGSGYTFQPGEAKIIVHALLYDPENTVELLQLVGRPERDRQGRQRRRGRCISPHDFADILDLSFETFSSFDPDCVIRCMLELGRWTVSQYSDSLYDVIKSSRLGVKGVVAVARVLVDKLTEELEWRRECNVETWDNWFDDALPCIVHAFTRFGATPEDHDLGHEDPKRNDLRHDDPDISLRRDDPRRDIDKIAGVVWKLCAEDEATMAVVIRHLPEHESTTDGSNCPCLFAAAMGHRCISRDARERIMGNFKALVKDATCPEPANGLSPEKLCDVAKCMRNHQASYSEEKSQWRVFYSLLCPGDHARGDSGDTIVESQPDSLDELSHEQPLDSAYEEGPPGQPDPFMKRTMFQRPRYSSPTPLSPNMSLESGKTAVESGYTIVDPRRAKSMNSGEGWHAGYSPAIENGQSSPTERGFGEFKFIGPMQSTPVKQARKRRRLD
ncbi:uncharacterized protein PHACADRAFT_30045 [Phanerochaete carnosa HHB-10118-sp]|uniref:Uncharacterized protein n=1 Tax=Phanerochaete carnosa (strain HHB-10118-sp) TaxID=650164 RepID=K5VTU7_PHACS|nr:uncharacterized protein PHACADRAFT_30045 [Phanerochaete carnosa HHB-10118-sp]EKM54918.1 hypothetical protein PHACADRAFT_30045 [Phanerochaete carnosa HHB-10118-sp]